MVPLAEAAAATTARGMLGYEYGMASHRSLLAVIWNISRSEPSGYEVLSMLAYSGQSF